MDSNGFARELIKVKGIVKGKHDFLQVKFKSLNFSFLNL